MCPETRCTYPLCLPRDGVNDGIDLASYHTDLVRRAPDLFFADETASRVDLLVFVSKTRMAQPISGSSSMAQVQSAQTGPPATQQLVISTLESLHGELSEAPQPGITRIFTIRRANSWSRMKITLAMFQSLCSSSQATPRILDVVRGMRFKSSATDEHMMGCYSSVRLSGTLPETQTGIHGSSSFEICYNLRHFERHGRDLEDPWSCRQSAFHQRYHFSTAVSTWITVQPPSGWEIGLEDARPNHGSHPLALHLRAISSAIAVNLEYLEYMSSIISGLDRRVTFPKPVAEFDFDFTISQNVQAVRRKLYRMKTVLDGTQRIVSALLSLARAIREPGKVSPERHQMLLRELEGVSRDLKSYHSTTDELLKLSADIKTTIHSIISFKNQETLNNNEAALRLISEQNASESGVINKIAKLSYKDSRTMRIATVIALTYLPVNLVLTFFSTSFIEMLGPGSNDTVRATFDDEIDGARLVIHKQAWIIIPCMMMLVIVTSGWFLLWNRRLRSKCSSFC